MPPEWDILGLGVVSVDELLYVDAFPAPDEKTRVRRRERQCGGLTGTALVAAARLGARAAYGGLLGDNERSAVVEANFRANGVDTGPAVRAPDARPVHSTIVVGSSGRTRNIFFAVTGRTGADDHLPAADIIRSARVLFVDHYGVSGSLRAIDVARAAGVEVVADLERDEHPRWAELLDAVDHPVLSEKFALKVTGAPTARDAVRRLWNGRRRAVVVTCGDRGCWYAGGREPEAVRHCPAFLVQVVDTTGCGDVFHGAYAAALVRGLELSERVVFASAAAAIKASSPGGQKGIPDREAVERFIAART